MENKNEKSMTLEEMISEMLKDAKVKVPLPAKAEEKTETQEQDKPMPARPSGVPFLSLSIKNLHVHMDERMTSYNYGIGQESAEDSLVDAEDDPLEDIDIDEMVEHIRKETGLCKKAVLEMLAAQVDYLEELWGEDADEEDEE